MYTIENNGQLRQKTGRDARYVACHVIVGIYGRLSATRERNPNAKEKEAKRDIDRRSLASPRES